jgi:flagellar biosynthetic protein FliP
MEDDARPVAESHHSSLSITEPQRVCVPKRSQELEPDSGRRESRRRAWLRRILVVVGLPICALACGWLSASLTAAGAEPVTTPTVTAPVVTTPSVPTTPTTASNGASINVNLGGLTGSDGKKPDQSIIIILLLTVLAVAPALLVMLTSFTRIVIVLSLTRNALGLPSIPPNQVVIGLAIFLSLFVMAPTLTKINDDALQPLLNGKLDFSHAYDKAQVPLRDFMLNQTRRGELNMFINASGEKAPSSRDKVPLSTLIPAFILSELKTAFIIGFVIFIPFLIIDLVVSSTLMSMGMFMLPPVLVSLPFKLLLFVMVDGWALVVSSLITSFHH